MADSFLKSEKFAATAPGLLECEMVLSRLVWTNGGFGFTGAKDDAVTVRIPATTAAREYRRGPVRPAAHGGRLAGADPRPDPGPQAPGGVGGDRPGGDRPGRSTGRRRAGVPARTGWCGGGDGRGGGRPSRGRAERIVRLRYGPPPGCETLMKCADPADDRIGQARKGPEGSERECGRPAP